MNEMMNNLLKVLGSAGVVAATLGELLGKQIIKKVDALFDDEENEVSNSNTQKPDEE